MRDTAALERLPELSPVAREHIERLMQLRDEFVMLASNGRFIDAAGREWSRLPSTWRMTLLLVAGIGVDVEHLDVLAGREWREMPEPERAAVRATVRDCKRNVCALYALAARV